MHSLVPVERQTALAHTTSVSIFWVLELLYRLLAVHFCVNIFPVAWKRIVATEASSSTSGR